MIEYGDDTIMTNNNIPKNYEGKKTSWNVFFCGTGGQGVLTAAEICAVTAMDSGFHVKKSEVHGMAQRGGSVESHVRFGEKIFSPLIEPQDADIIVCFHKDEGERLSGYLKKGGRNFIDYIDKEEYRPSDRRFANTFFLGMLSTFLPMNEEKWTGAMGKKFKRNMAENIQAFYEGRKAAQE
jgi:indolepyruvate ferredoxin oxidoreductase, beta subunit